MQFFGQQSLQGCLKQHRLEALNKIANWQIIIQQLKAVHVQVLYDFGAHP